jgi:hypothetical protein
LHQSAAMSNPLEEVAAAVAEILVQDVAEGGRASNEAAAPVSGVQESLAEASAVAATEFNELLSIGSMLPLLWRVFREWRAGMWRELEAYESGGNTRLQLAATVLIYFFSSFYLEIYRLGAHPDPFPSEQSKTGEKKRRGKRDKIEGIEKKKVRFVKSPKGNIIITRRDNPSFEESSTQSPAQQSPECRLSPPLVVTPPRPPRIIRCVTSPSGNIIFTHREDPTFEESSSICSQEEPGKDAPHNPLPTSSDVAPLNDLTFFTPPESPKPSPKPSHKTLNDSSAKANGSNLRFSDDGQNARNESPLRSSIKPATSTAINNNSEDKLFRISPENGDKIETHSPKSDASGAAEKAPLRSCLRSSTPPRNSTEDIPNSVTALSHCPGKVVKMGGATTTPNGQLKSSLKKPTLPPAPSNLDEDDQGGEGTHHSPPPPLKSITTVDNSWGIAAEPDISPISPTSPARNRDRRQSNLNHLRLPSTNSQTLPVTRTNQQEQIVSMTAIDDDGDAAPDPEIVAVAQKRNDDQAANLQSATLLNGHKNEGASLVPTTKDGKELPDWIKFGSNNGPDGSGSETGSGHHFDQSATTLLTLDSALDDNRTTEEDVENVFDNSKSMIEGGRRALEQAVSFDLTPDERELENTVHRRNTFIHKNKFNHDGDFDDDDDHDDDESEEALDELEKIAIALKSGLTYITKKDRLKKKVFKNCFRGSAAVDFLCQHTHARRAEALLTGRKIARHFGLFVLVKGASKKKKKNQSLPAQPEDDQLLDKYLLRDSAHVYYRMFGFLPSEVKRMPMQRKMHIFEQGVKLKDLRKGLKTYRSCFRGKDGVTFLVQSGLAASRQEAVDLGNRFIVEFNMFEPVNRQDAFKDAKDVLYRFVDKKNRYFSIGDALSTRLVEFQGNAVDWGETDDENRDSDVMGLKSTDDDVDLWENKLSHDEFDVFGSKSGSSSESDSESDSDAEDDMHELRAADYQHLCEIAEILERGVKLKKQGTFAGSRAVTFMVTSGLAESRQEAEILGRKLEREFKLFQEVTGTHDFSDSNHYFRFTDPTERYSNPLKIQLPLDELAKAFEQGVKVKDYIHNLKTYKETFVGTKAVDFLVNSRLAINREEAVRIGRELVEHFNLFERVTGDRVFSDDYVYFRFTAPEQRRNPNTSSPPPKKRDIGSLLVPNSIHRRGAIVPKAVTEELLELAEWFLTGVKVRDNKFRAKTYRQTFVGSEAVSFMVNNSRAMSRKEAVDLGRCLSYEISLFTGIDGSKDFKDDYLLYRFEERFADTFEEQTMPQRGLVHGIEGISGVSVKSIPLEKIAEAFRSGVKVADQRGRVKMYKRVFVGRDAVDFLVGHGLTENRVQAVDLGRSLAREFGLFAHVKNEHEFKDEKRFYRFCYEGEIRPLEVLELDKLRLTEIAKGLLANVKVKEHNVKLQVYKDTFVGSEAVDYLVNSGFASSRIEAVQMGRAVTKEFNLFEHVTNDRKFEDGNLLYYFAKEEDRYRGLKFEKQRARRNVFERNSDIFSSEQFGQLDDSLSSLGGELSAFKLSEEDAELAGEMRLFAQRVQHALHPHLKRIDNDDDSIERVRKHTINRFFMWASKFRRLDPRYQIQYFFDYVAQDGGRNVEDQAFTLDDLRPFLNFLPNHGQVFSVWRPTSLHAIRKMMLGQAVGKGLGK